MKVLHIAPTPFFADRGCHMRILGEVGQLSSLGHKVVIATYHNGRDVSDLDIKRILNIPWYNKLEAGGSWHKLYLDILLLWTSIRTFVKLKPDIIHGHLHEGALIGWVVSLLASGGTIPVIFDVQGSLSGELDAYGLVNNKSLLKKIFFVIEKLICKLPDHFVCSSESNKDFINSMMGVPGHKITTIPDGIDPEFFSPLPNEKFNEELGIQDSKKIVLYTGSLMKSKGIDYLMNAIPLVVRNFDDVLFLIVGHPVEHCQKRVGELKLEKYVHFTGRVDYFRLPNYLSIADIAVDPKMDAAGEGSGKIMNYMGSGLPVVCFDTINNRAFLGKNGFFAKPGDSKDLADKIVQVLKNDSLAKETGEKNRKRGHERFSWPASIASLSSIYMQAIIQDK